MEENERKPGEPELRFGAPTEQEVERSRNLTLIVILLVGPYLLLTILGYHDAAAVVLMLTIGVIISVVRPSFHQRRPWEDDKDEVIELNLKERPPNAAKPKGFTSLLKTNFKRR